MSLTLIREAQWDGDTPDTGADKALEDAYHAFVTMSN